MAILNHKIVDFDRYIRIPTEIDILNNLYDQGVDIDTMKLGSKQYKRLFFNYYIKNIIKYISESDRKCFFVISKPHQATEFFNYFDTQAINTSYTNSLRKLLTLIPIIYLHDPKLSYDDILETNKEEWFEKISIEIKNQRDKIHNKSFKTIKKTAEYYDLKYIDSVIFNDLKSKLLF